MRDHPKEKEFEEKLCLLDHLQSSCTHCGLCSETCATFQSTGWEHESPRGRLHLAAQFLHGRIHPKSAVLSTFDHCLGCQACELLCPHQVPYHRIRQIVQELRREYKFFSSPAMRKAQYQQWITIAWRIGNIFWRHWGTKWLKIPTLDCQSLGSFTKGHKRSQTHKPVLAVCCVQDLFQHDVIKTTLDFMQRLGFPIEVDCKQPCCGAIFERLVEGGEETVCYPKEQRKAAFLQNKALKNFMKWMPSQTYFLSRGCQCFISKQNVHAFDLYAQIEAILDQLQLTLYFPEPQIAYYQPYCNFQKGGQDSIWRLLHRIQGLRVHELPPSQACCGGYGGETLLHPTQAERLSRQKISHLPNHATLVVTSPDCLGLFKNHSLGRNLTICYPIQLLSQTLVDSQKPHKNTLN